MAPSHAPRAPAARPSALRRARRGTSHTAAARPNCHRPALATPRVRPWAVCGRRPGTRRYTLRWPASANLHHPRPSRCLMLPSKPDVRSGSGLRPRKVVTLSGPSVDATAGAGNRGGADRLRGRVGHRPPPGRSKRSVARRSSGPGDALAGEGGELHLRGGDSRVARLRAKADLLGVDEGHVGHPDEAKQLLQIRLLEVDRFRRAFAAAPKAAISRTSSIV